MIVAYEIFCYDFYKDGALNVVFSCKHSDGFCFLASITFRKKPKIVCQYFIPEPVVKRMSDDVFFRILLKNDI